MYSRKNKSFSGYQSSNRLLDVDNGGKRARKASLADVVTKMCNQAKLQMANQSAKNKTVKYTDSSTTFAGAAGWTITSFGNIPYAAAGTTANQRVGQQCRIRGIENITWITSSDAYENPLTTGPVTRTIMFIDKQCNMVAATEALLFELTASNGPTALLNGKNLNRFVILYDDTTVLNNCDNNIAVTATQFEANWRDEFSITTDYIQTFVAGNALGDVAGTQTNRLYIAHYNPATTGGAVYQTRVLFEDCGN